MVVQEFPQILRKILILELASLILVILSFYLSISNYSSLPNLYPIHFDYSGTPNGWTRKSWSDVLGLPLLQLGIFSFITVLTMWEVYSVKPRTYPDEKQKTIRLLSAIFINVLNFLISFLIITINYQLLQAEITGRGDSLFGIVFVVVICLVAGMIAMKKIISAIIHTLEQ